MIPIVIGALNTVPKGLVERLNNLGTKVRVKIVQITLLRPPSILRMVHKISRHLLSLRILWKTVS